MLRTDIVLTDLPPLPQDFIGPMRPDDTAYPDDAARPVVALPKRRKFARRLKARMSKVAGHKAFLPIMATAGCGAYLIATGVAGWAMWALQDMPAMADLNTEKRPATVTYLDRHGREIGVRGSRGSRPVSLAMVADSLPAAVLSVEDRRFYNHPGIDPIGIARAIYVNKKRGRLVQGGSTLSQQLAKNVFLTDNRTLRRKSQEALLALWLEHKYTKDEILELYLGRVYFGSSAYGVEAAAERYFAKTVADLSLGESAMLAGLLKAPSNYSPAADVKAAAGRTTVVLNVMVDAGAINEAERDAAFARPILIEAPSLRGSADYFLDWIDPLVTAQIGEPTEDLIVQTTLDLPAQKAGEAAINKYLRPKARATQAALVAMDGTGGVRAMIGGADYGLSEFNRASNARRQPGSAFKPFVYLAALRAGVSPWEARVDESVTIGDWQPENFSGRYKGQVTVTGAFAESLNTIAVMLSEQAGRDAVIKTASDFGIEDLKPLRSIALGAQETTPLTLTQSYLPFANWGYRAQAYGIESIYTPGGKRIYSRIAPDMPRVISGDDLRDMNLLMHRTVESGTGKSARLPGREVAGKTGTTNDYRDAWFMGYTPDYVTGVWVGDDENRSMNGITGGSIPALIWKDYMKAALKGTPAARLPKSELPIRTTDADRLNQLLGQIETKLP